MGTSKDSSKESISGQASTQVRRKVGGSQAGAGYRDKYGINWR